MGRGQMHLEPETDKLPGPETARGRLLQAFRWMMPMPAPRSLHKHVRSPLLDDIFQAEILLAGWNAGEARRPPSFHRQRAANRTAAGSNVPDKVHMIFTEERRTCDAGPGIAASCSCTKCLYSEMKPCFFISGLSHKLIIHVRGVIITEEEPLPLRDDFRPRIFAAMQPSCQSHSLSCNKSFHHISMFPEDCSRLVCEL